MNDYLDRFILPCSLLHIRQALTICTAENQVTLELCPTSNLNTAIFSRYEDYPLRPLMEAGVHVSINTDNMTVSNTTLQNEWDLLINALHLTRCEQQLIVSNTIDACFCSEELKN